GVTLGFLGVAAIVRPGSAAFSWVIVLPLLSAVFYSSTVLLTRSKCRDEDPIGIALALHGGVVPPRPAAPPPLFVAALGVATKATYPFLLGDWAVMGVREWSLMASIGVISAGFILGVARAYQIAPPQIIATFEYGYAVSAAVWGFMFFSETPDVFKVLGM